MIFRVDKYSNSNLQTRVQSYFIPATNEDISLLDTQIFHDKEYFYVVNAYILVYGTSYSYSLVDMWETRGSFQAEVSINTRPDFRIYEVEMFRTNSTVIETPLNKPSAVFLNSSNQENVVSFRIQQPLSTLRVHLSSIASLQQSTLRQSCSNTSKD